MENIKNNVGIILFLLDFVIEFFRVMRGERFNEAQNVDLIAEIGLVAF